MTNTWHFEIPTGDPDAWFDEITEELSTFYNTVHGAPGGFADYIAWSAAHVNFYLLELAPPRIPETRPLTFGGISTSPSTIPAEAAIVLSFQGAPSSGQLQARRRGRVYLGGFVNPTVGSTTVSPPRLNPAVLQDIVDAATVLRNALSGVGPKWAVYSPTNDDTYPVTNGWVDNEPDTQRRRGARATLRNVWPL